MKNNSIVLKIINDHTCEACSRDCKRHLLDHWYDIINRELPRSKRITNTKALAKIFQALKKEGVFREKFLLGKGKGGIKDNFYIYQKLYK